jgi:hypothetical protein
VSLQERIQLLTELGHFIRSGGDESLETAIQQSYIENNWFTPENTRAALAAIAEEMLAADKLNAWAAKYPVQNSDYPTKTIGLIMAGNIPLVGFHDWLCVFLSGHRARVKCSDKDKRLLPMLVGKLGSWQHEAYAYTEFLSDAEKLSGFDAVIATGSNNTARYFEQYFGKYPHIIRRNRNAIAVLNGLETREELMALGRDIFTYFGLGCRNVSKLYVPHGYQFDFLLETLHEFRELANHNKYKNNFDYNFTLFILNQMKHFNNGCLLLKEDASLQARIASVHYEYYDEIHDLDALLAGKKEEIQCVVGNVKLADYAVLPFGQSQSPGLTDYPDGVDVMAFLTGL